MLSRRLLLGLPSRLPENRCILVQSTSKAGGQVRPAGVVQMCPPESRMPEWASLREAHSTLGLEMQQKIRETGLSKNPFL